MNFNPEQKQAIGNLYHALVQSLSATPGFTEYIAELQSVGLRLTEANIDLSVVTLEDDSVPAQSDAAFLASMHIAPDLKPKSGPFRFLKSRHRERP
jgi:hypothetical protein